MSDEKKKVGAARKKDRLDRKGKLVKLKGKKIQDINKKELDELLIIVCSMLDISSVDGTIK